MDKRYELAKERFESLSTEELYRILYNTDKTLYDTDNYNDGKFCPIAIAMNLHNTVQNPTDELIKEKIGERFYPTNIFKGVEGEFYTSDRKNDVLEMVVKIINARNIRYEFQVIDSVDDGINYRITDKRTDSRIGTCYVESNAQLIVAALNAYVK